MIDYSAINLERLIIHRVGNKNKGKENFVSNISVALDDKEATSLINFFLTPFSKQVEVNKLSHHTNNLSLNEIYSYATELFKNQQSFQKVSVNILQHLFEQSVNPNIKPGELMIAYFTDIIFDDEVTDALGIFKIERKQKFFKFPERNRNLGIDFDEGASSRKMDKGCLIINTNGSDGFRVLSVDNNNYDTEYWKNQFLEVKYVKDFNYHTSHYVDFCKSFSEDVLENKKGKDEQIAFLNKSINYLQKKEEFDINEFADEIFDEPEMRREFFDYKKAFEEQKETEVEDTFQVSQNTVKAKKRIIKSLINLDTKIQIKLDSADPETTQKYIEKGYDNKRGMNFYKVYYNVEEK